MHIKIQILGTILEILIQEVWDETRESQFLNPLHTHIHTMHSYHRYSKYLM